MFLRTPLPTEQTSDLLRACRWTKVELNPQVEPAVSTYDIDTVFSLCSGHLEDWVAYLRNPVTGADSFVFRDGTAYARDGAEPKSQPVVDTLLEPSPGLAHTPHAEPQNHEPPQMAQADNIVIQNGTLFKGGLPYRPLSAAASSARTHRTTLLNWIKNKTPFAGRPLEGYHLALANRYYVSEESVERAANRFIKWQNGKPAGPAGPVTIGATRDKTGYIGITKAGQSLGVDHHTIWLWTAHGTAPTEKPLDVIKDPASDQFYIRETDIAHLKKLIPRSGLKPGRRAQLGTPKP